MTAKLSTQERDYLISKIRTIPDFPKQGILFRDITTLLNDGDALGFLLEHLEERYEGMELDFIAETALSKSGWQRKMNGHSTIEIE